MNDSIDDPKTSHGKRVRLLRSALVIAPWVAGGISNMGVREARNGANKRGGGVVIRFAPGRRSHADKDPPSSSLHVVIPPPLAPLLSAWQVCVCFACWQGLEDALPRACLFLFNVDGSSPSLCSSSSPLRLFRSPTNVIVLLPGGLKAVVGKLARGTPPTPQAPPATPCPL